MINDVECKAPCVIAARGEAAIECNFGFFGCLTVNAQFTARDQRIEYEEISRGERR